MLLSSSNPSQARKVQTWIPILSMHSAALSHHSSALSCPIPPWSSASLTALKAAPTPSSGYLVGHFSKPHHSSLFQPRIPGVQDMHTIPTNRGRQRTNSVHTLPNGTHYAKEPPGPKCPYDLPKGRARTLILSSGSASCPEAGPALEGSRGLALGTKLIWTSCFGGEVYAFTYKS